MSKTSKKKSTYVVPKEALLQDYEMMLLIRRFEEKTAQAYGMKLIGGFCHLYIGQEAVIVGMKGVMHPEDTIIATYRTHGHMLACGMHPGRVLAELMGRKDGFSKGKGGSMHMFSKEEKFYGGHGIVGAPISLGTGLGFALKYKKSPGVSVSFIGDGGVNQGQVYESFNMAALWKLPVLYIIENNYYGMGTAVGRASANSDNLWQRGAAHGIPGEAVDGMDVMAVREATERALEHCRSGKGPYILEMRTYRYRGHSMSDPANYRTKEEVDKMKSERDPIGLLGHHLLENGLATEEQLQEADKKAKKVAKDAFEFANASPEPDVSELWTDMLA